MVRLEQILSVLQEAGVKFVVIGGAAMYARGSPHLTRDLDICYERSSQNLEGIARALAPHHPHLRGAPADLPFVLDARSLARGMNFTLDTDLGELDLLGEVAGLGQYPEVAKYSSPILVAGRPCDTLSIRGLILAKRAAGRPRDLEAVRELEALAELEDQAEASGTADELQ
jgi:hypothetical protein